MVSICTGPWLCLFIYGKRFFNFASAFFSFSLVSRHVLHILPSAFFSFSLVSRHVLHILLGAKVRVFHPSLFDLTFFAYSVSVCFVRRKQLYPFVRLTENLPLNHSASWRKVSRSTLRRALTYISICGYATEASMLTQHACLD
jgi:hypothetical protein